MKKSSFWKKYWSKKKGSEIEKIGRSSYTTSQLFLYYSDCIEKLGELNKKDTLLDVGGGNGLFANICYSFLKKIYIVDYSENLVSEAKKKFKLNKKINVILDNILELKKIKKKKFDKILVGSVLQYLNNYDEIKMVFKVLRNLSKKKTIIYFTHNPDAQRKKKFLNSYKKLDWNSKKIQKALIFENKKRLWLDYKKISKIAKNTGFISSKKIIPNKSLFETSHMFNFYLKIK